MRIFLTFLALAMSLLAQKKDPAMEPITDEPGLPRVLLIGDSISIGYTVPARDAMKGKANVHRILVNGSNTVTGLANIDAWLGTGKWDVIHFNWGLHDLKHYKDGKMDPTGPILVPVVDYEKNLRDLVVRLKKTGAKLIFATTTPVPEKANGRDAGLELKYKEAAVRVMNDTGVKVNDLHALCMPNLAEWQRPRDVHFKAEGYKKLGEKVAAEIATALGAK
jgi:lysophospholipase L1-like esterase